MLVHRRNGHLAHPYDARTGMEHGCRSRRDGIRKDSRRRAFEYRSDTLRADIEDKEGHLIFSLVDLSS